MLLFYVDRCRVVTPAAAQSEIQISKRRLLVAHGIAQADTRVKVATLSVKHIKISDSAVYYRGQAEKKL